MDDVAPDGSPVAFYRRLPDSGESALIHGLVGPGASILDETSLRTLLGRGGLAFDRWLDRPGWFVAAPAR